MTFAFMYDVQRGFVRVDAACSIFARVVVAPAGRNVGVIHVGDVRILMRLKHFAEASQVICTMEG